MGGIFTSRHRTRRAGMGDVAKTKERFFFSSEGKKEKEQKHFGIGFHSIRLPFQALTDPIMSPFLSLSHSPSLQPLTYIHTVHTHIL